MRRIAFTLAVILVACAGAGRAAERIRTLIVTGQTDPSHDWHATAPFLKGILENTGRFEVKRLEEPRGLTGPTLAPYQLLVLNYNGPRWGEASERAVEEFLRAGNGMIAVHGVSYGTFFGMDPLKGLAVVDGR